MQLLIVIAGLAFSVILHEVAHGLVADWLGDKTARVMGRLTLNPISHIDPFMTIMLPLFLILANSPIVFGGAKPVPVNFYSLKYGRKGMALVAAAGPLTNLLIAALLAVWARLFPSAAPVLTILIVINLALMIFNLIPFPPLDGSRIVYAFVPPLRELYDRIERFGVMGIFLLLFLGFGFIGPIIIAAVSGLATLLLGHSPGF